MRSSRGVDTGEAREGDAVRLLKLESRAAGWQTGPDLATEDAWGGSDNPPRRAEGLVF